MSPSGTSMTWRPWEPWEPVTRQNCDSTIHWAYLALELAEEWLSDFGLALIHDATSPPDAWADLDRGRFAFRIDRPGSAIAAAKSIVVIVTVEWDGAPDGRSYATAVEVRRA